MGRKRLNIYIFRLVNKNYEAILCKPQLRQLKRLEWNVNE